jgi:hypothetical protein
MPFRRPGVGLVVWQSVRSCAIVRRATLDIAVRIGFDCPRQPAVRAQRRTTNYHVRPRLAARFGLCLAQTLAFDDRTARTEGRREDS